MSDSELPPQTLAEEILSTHDDIAPLLSEVVNDVRMLRACGLSDATIRQTVPGMYRLQQQQAASGTLTEPDAEEIRVLSLPSRYQRDDWL